MSESEISHVSATGGGGREHSDPTHPAAAPTHTVPTLCRHPFLCLAPKKPRRPEALHIAVFRCGADGTLAVKEPESVSQAEKRLLVPLLQTGGGPGELGGAELCFADWLIWAQGLLLLLPPTQEAPTVLFARKGVSSEAAGLGAHGPSVALCLAALAEGRGK